MIEKKYITYPAEYCPECTDPRGHAWVHIYGPPKNESGLHREQCARCEVVIEYDTSD